MPHLAQTNVQLIRQLIDANWSDDDLRRLRRAYELIMWAYSGQYRSNGKTQIAHHMGTASALAVTGHRPTVVIAGLTHSLYFLGEFGSGRLGPHEEKRERVCATLGEGVEALVYGYTDMEWGLAAVAQLTETADRATTLQRDVVAMRIANELDEFTDFAMRLAVPHHSVDLLSQDGIDALVKLATAYGFEELGAWLHDAYARGVAEPLPAVLVSKEDNTVFVPPASFARRFHIVLQDSRIGHRVAESVPGARRVAVWVRRRIA